MKTKTLTSGLEIKTEAFGFADKIKMLARHTPHLKTLTRGALCPQAEGCQAHQRLGLPRLNTISQICARFQNRRSTSKFVLL